jgi:hypothetical protein
MAEHGDDVPQRLDERADLRLGQLAAGRVSAECSLVAAVLAFDFGDPFRDGCDLAALILPLFGLAS